MTNSLKSRSVQRRQEDLDSVLSASRFADQVLASDAFLRGGVSLDSLVVGWRNELFEFQDLAQQSVADAMAATAASSSLAALSVARLPEIEVPNLGRAMWAWHDAAQFMGCATPQHRRRARLPVVRS